MSLGDHHDPNPLEQPDPNLLRVEDDGEDTVVVFDDEQALVDGKPFTGVIFSVFPDGRLETEETYRDGLRDGLCRWWYPDGTLQMKWYARWNQGATESWEWHPSGALKSHRIAASDSRQAAYWEWNEHGALVEHLTDIDS